MRLPPNVLKCVTSIFLIEWFDCPINDFPQDVRLDLLEVQPAETPEGTYTHFTPRVILDHGHVSDSHGYKAIDENITVTCIQSDFLTRV
jgi:hypothetical protein